MYVNQVDYNFFYKGFNISTSYFLKIMKFQKIIKINYIDVFNECSYNRNFSKNQICKLAILNFSKTFNQIFLKKRYIIHVTNESIQLYGIEIL